MKKIILLLCVILTFTLCLASCGGTGTPGGDEIPDGTKFICTRAFDDCISLRTIVIPDSVTYIGSFVFNNCATLKEIIKEHPQGCIFVWHPSLWWMPSLFCIQVGVLWLSRLVPRPPKSQILSFDLKTAV